MLSKVALLATLLATGTARAQSEWDGTGCVMDADSELMKCLGNYASVPPVAPTGLTNDVQAAYYCNIYTQLANCWSVGLYCREWQPLALAAQKFCVLANGTAQTTSGSSASSEPVFSILPFPPLTASATTAPASVSVASEVLTSVIAEASNVVTSIWNNDVGTAIPSITNEFITDVLPTWTHVTTATPSPATDPLASGGTSVAVPTPLKRLRFARDGY